MQAECRRDRRVRQRTLFCNRGDTPCQRNRRTPSQRVGRRSHGGVKRTKRILLCFTGTGLHLGYHLDPVQGPAGCRPREVSPLPSAAAHLAFTASFRSRTQHSRPLANEERESTLGIATPHYNSTPRKYVRSPISRKQVLSPPSRKQILSPPSRKQSLSPYFRNQILSPSFRNRILSP
jgi:hypothetical protein